MTYDWSYPWGCKNPRDVKEPSHYSKGVGDVVPGVVVYLHSLTSSLIMAWKGSLGSKMD